MTSPRPIRTLLFSTLYPSSARPRYGIFVETRLREQLNSGEIETRVIAPVPWFFSRHPRYGDYARMANTPQRETLHGVDVQYPRYFLPPKVGMNIAPFALALGALPAVRRLLEEGYDFDVIDAHYYYPDGVATALLARYFNKPFTVTALGSDINLLATHPFPRRLMCWAANRASASIGVSRALTDAMANMGMPLGRLMTMPNGVDLQRFYVQPQAAARAQLGWPQGPTLLSAGNLVENKGHHLAIGALTQLPGFRLVIAGEGPELQALKVLAERLDLSSRVQFMGSVDQEQLARCYSASDMLVLASSREGWPNVLLESMACGAPVVATRVGGIPEIVTSVHAGRLMAGRTASDVAAAVLDLWRHLPDRLAVRACAQKCGWQSTTESQIKLFRRIAEVSP